MVYLNPPGEEIDHSSRVFFNLPLHRVGYRLVTDSSFFKKIWGKGAKDGGAFRLPLIRRRFALFPSLRYPRLARALRATGRFEEVVSTYRKAFLLALDNISIHVGLTVTYSLMGREKEARAEAAEVLRINQKFFVDSWSERQPNKDQSEVDKLANVLRKARLK